MKHDFSNNWHLTSGLQFQRADRDISTQIMALTDNAGSYNASLASGFAPRFTVLGHLTSLNGRFTTGRFGHTVAFGVTGYQFKTYSDFVNPPAASVRLGSASIANPVVFALPPAGIPTHTNIFNSGVINQQGFNMVDSIALTRRWSTRIAISQDWIWTNNYNNAGVRTGGYKDNGLSPLASLLFKPTSRTTLYGTYGNSLQQGDIAPTTASNASEALPPYRSTQTEVGYKIAFPLIDLATAVFRINRPFAMTDPADNVFKISGDQVNTGFEAIVTGRVTRAAADVRRFHRGRSDAHEDRQPADRRQAVREHSEVQVEPADRVPVLRRGHLRERQLAVRRPPADRRHQLDLHAGLQRRRPRRPALARAWGTSWPRGSSR